jgi:hypothetical protein
MRALEEQGEMTRGLTAVMTASYRTIVTRVRLLSCLVSSRLVWTPLPVCLHRYTSPDR